MVLCFVSVCVFMLFPVVVDSNLNQSEMVTKQQEIIFSSARPAPGKAEPCSNELHCDSCQRFSNLSDLTTSQILPQLNISTEEISSNISGFHCAYPPPGCVSCSDDAPVTVVP